jgi:hypothetical protein
MNEWIKWIEINGWRKEKAIAEGEKKKKKTEKKR